MRPRFVRRLPALAVGIVLAATLVVPESAANAAEANGLRCNASSSTDGFRIGWLDGPDKADRYVVERMAFGRTHWRGRASGEESSFQDGPAPKGSASMRYWVKALDRKRRVIEQAECTMLGSLHCWSSNAAGGGVEVRWQGLSADDNTDVIIRRSVREGQAPWWRARLSAEFATGSFYDRPSPTGWAKYQLVLRRDKRVIEVSDCEPPDCRIVRQVEKPTAAQTVKTLRPVEGQAVEVDPESGLSPAGLGYQDPDGMIWFIASRNGSRHDHVVVRQDPASGVLLIGPGVTINDPTNWLIVTKSRVLIGISGKGSYGSVVDVIVNKGEIEIRRATELAKGTSILESADGALLVYGTIHNVSGLQYVPIGATKAVWLESPNDQGLVGIHDLTFGPGNTVFYTRQGQWFLADLSCHA